MNRVIISDVWYVIDGQDVFMYEIKDNKIKEIIKRIVKNENK